MVTGIYSFYRTCPGMTSYRDFQSLIPTIVPMSTRCTQGSRSCENFGPKWQRAWMWLPGSKAPTRHGHGLPLSAHLLLQLAPLQLIPLLPSLAHHLKDQPLSRKPNAHFVAIRIWSSTKSTTALSCRSIGRRSTNYPLGSVLVVRPRLGTNPTTKNVILKQTEKPVRSTPWPAPPPRTRSSQEVVSRLRSELTRTQEEEAQSVPPSSSRSPSRAHPAQLVTIPASPVLN